jgi:hypothetical protein
MCDEEGARVPFITHNAKCHKMTVNSATAITKTYTFTDPSSAQVNCMWNSPWKELNYNV